MAKIRVVDANSNNKIYSNEQTSSPSPCSSVGSSSSVVQEIHPSVIVSKIKDDVSSPAQEVQSKKRRKFRKRYFDLKAMLGKKLIASIQGRSSPVGLWHDDRLQPRTESEETIRGITSLPELGNGDQYKPFYLNKRKRRT